MSISEKTLIKLELPEVLQLLVQNAQSEGGRHECENLRPMQHQAQIRRCLDETECAKIMIAAKGAPSFSSCVDVRASLKRADAGGSLSTRQLLDVARLLKCARLARAYWRDAGSVGGLDGLFCTLSGNKYLEEKIEGAIVSEDEISDSASSELASIRRKIRIANGRVREMLQKIITSPTYSKALQEPIITTRSGRFVVPVKAESKNAISGIVHDVSSSGATVFIEPTGVVQANNEIRELEIKQQQEIERILAELSADCAGFAEDIKRDYEVLVCLDVIFAKAKLSYQMDAMQPEISEGELVLKKARHPLLKKETAVPIDLTLGVDFDTLVITGPNTGGKTVAIKTIGLLTLMAMCGLHIPASDGSRIPLYSGVFADIGDEQSIAQSLSTFSSHMTNISQIMQESTRGSLMLFDELGAGTDPVEGAALAVSIIEAARRAGCFVAATTHYAELKSYATTTPGVANGSCEFDSQTLRPTYRLLIGIPGKSNAFAISKRLGLRQEIIDDAASRVSSESRSLEAVIEKLEAQRLEMEGERSKTLELLRKAQENEKKSSLMRRELEVRLEKADIKAKNEAKRILEDARLEAEAVFSELDEIRRMQEKESDHKDVNDARANLRRRLNAAEDKLDSIIEAAKPPRRSQRRLEIGDTVEILSLGVKAAVTDISPDRVLTLQAGIMQVSAREDEVVLLPVEKVSVKRQGSGQAPTLKTASCAREIDLRGMMSDEAVYVMEKYIDSAVMARLETVTIIHGKGTGALRAAVAKSLKQNKTVKSFRLGTFGEGEEGVTVVTLK